MSMAETAKLAVDLSFKSNAGTILGGVNRQLGTVDTSAAKLHKGFTTLGAGIGTAIRNGAVLATGALVALGGLIAESVKEGQEATKVQQIYATAIGNSGKVSASYVGILNAQQKALMNLAGVDDELIKSEQTRLIQMGLTGDQVAKLTPLILDMSKATGKDLLTSTLAVGKAVNGNVAGLGRYGIQIDKAKAKTDPFGATLDALTKKFGGTTKALSGELDVRLGAFRENLANIREESGIKLLPALTRIVDVVGKSLVPAFGKFVDRILPDISKGIDTFASALEGGGAEKSINGIADALGSMIDLLKIAAGPVKMIVSAFLSLPKEVQGILVGGFAINKLSGGMIGQGLGQIAGGLIQRGGSIANPLYVQDVMGGLGNKGGPPVSPGGPVSSIFNTLKTIAQVALPALVLAELHGPAADLQTQVVGTPNLFTGQGPFAPLPGFVPGTQTTTVYNPGPSPSTHGSADRATAGGGSASPWAAIPKNIAVTLSAMGPGAAGVYQRAMAAGLHPSMATVAATLAKNVAATKATAAATARAAAAASKTTAAASKTTAAVFSGAEKTGLRLLGVKGAINATTAAINAKQFTASVTMSGLPLNLRNASPTSSPVIRVTAPVSARDVTVKTATRASYGRDRTIK